MAEAPGLRGAFCLIRLLPVLEVVESALTPSVESVVAELVAGGVVDDDVLIRLDDFRQAAGQQIGFERPPVGFEVWICDIALLAAGAVNRVGRPALTALLSDAQSVWGELTDLLAAGGATGPNLRDEEVQWQDSDAAAAEAGADDPAAIVQHIAALRALLAERKEALGRLVAELGWRPTGPCGAECDWPSCSPPATHCLHLRAFQPQQTLGAVLRRKHGAPSRQWFVRVLHLNAADDEPWEILSEVSAEGYETRKIVHFMSGERIPVDGERAIQGYSLRSEPFPAFAELQAPGFAVEELSKTVFDELWSSARAEFEGSH